MKNFKIYMPTNEEKKLIGEGEINENYNESEKGSGGWSSFVKDLFKGWKIVEHDKKSYIVKPKNTDQ